MTVAKILRYTAAACACLAILFTCTSCRGAQKMRTGVWVTVFSEEKVLTSQKGMDHLFSVCENAGITDIYLQIYRAGKAHFRTDSTDDTPFREIRKKTGDDPLKKILEKAGKKGVRVHAWLNILSIAHNDQADIIEKFGKDVLTKDQYARTPLRPDKPDDLDRYYIREDQLFLEPGDWRVRKYLKNIVSDLVKNYPGFSGLHLDYIRYPAAVPFIPGSRFITHGLSYGYTRVNLKAFKKATGIDLKNTELTRKVHREWDQWKRDKITQVVRTLSDQARSIFPDMEISCTIVPSMERAYLVTFQDWMSWLEQDITDHVVAMNYTPDVRLMELNTKALLMPEFRDRIYIGIGAYLLGEDDLVLREQLRKAKEAAPGGVVIFSYEDIAEDPEAQDHIRKLY